MQSEKLQRDSNEADGYCANLDILRLLAVAAIVWIHSVETPLFKAGIDWCRFAVPAFTATSVLLLVWRHGGDSAKELWTYVTGRATRIYLLFLAWNCIYAGIRFLEHCVLKGGDSIRWSPETFLLAGFAEQLWFLPFLAVVTVLAAAPAFILARLDSLQKQAFAMLLLTIGIALALLPSPINVNLDSHPASYWFVLSWSAFPSTLMIFGVLPLCSNIKITDPMRPLLAIAIILLVGLLLWLSIDNKYSNLLQNAAGVILTLGAILGPSSLFWKQALRKLGRLALPIYLFHVLFVHAIQAVGHREAHLPVCVTFDGAVFFAGLFGSGLAAWFLQKIPCTKWLVTVR